ncbi:MAG: metalloregulator ArsR/SmtB family transcription factor [Patescibacteria group bacterium]
MKSPFPKETYEKNAQVYKLLASPIRLEILNILKNKETSVDQLTKLLGIRKPNVSQHLSLLRHAGLIKTRKKGLNVYYNIINPEIVKPCKILHDLRVANII